VSREQVIGNASKVIKNRITEDMGLAAVVIAQQNRDLNNNAKTTQRVGGSYQIAQDCDNFIEIMTKTKKQMIEDGVHNGNRYIKIGKRRGGISDFMVHASLDTDERTASLRITEMTKPSEQAALYARLST